MKRAGIFNPYWTTLGGGERYTATVAKALERTSYAVSLYWSDKTLVSKLNQRFNISLDNTTVDPVGYQTIRTGQIWSKYYLESQLDCLFWVSDGSVPLMFSRNNVLHFQVPFHGIKQNQITNNLKFKRIGHVVCNSQFTKKIIDDTFGCQSQVIYPPVPRINPREKQPLILSVGRFDNSLHAKRQDVLIKAFKTLSVKNWQLVLAGGSEENNSYLETLKKMIGDTPITILPNPSFTELADIYGHASIYWHAAGYGIDLELHPEQAEHFGITTVEAMSAGAIPLVFAGGGQTEIVHSGENGLLWKTPAELISQTKALIQDHAVAAKLRQQAEKTAVLFSEARFKHEFNTILR